MGAQQPARSALPGGRRGAVGRRLAAHVRSGDWLMLLGESGTYVVVLTSGCVKVLGDPADGRTTLLAVRAAGDVVGELSVLDGEPAPPR
ncbi:cyclic nucleotide-binding domain-containing protein [Luedemannella flava]